MTTTQTDIVFANARLILPTDVIVGGLRVQNGQIVDIHQGAHVPPFAIDCEGRFLAPGLIELHTDNLERHMQPRP